MLEVRYSTKFKRDFKTCVKRRCKMEKLQQVIDTLRIPETLPLKNADHSLTGNYLDYRECHIEPDWLLMYQIYEDILILSATATGSHADLFGK